jgi:hypothetical protein
VVTPYKIKTEYEKAYEYYTCIVLGYNPDQDLIGFGVRLKGDSEYRSDLSPMSLTVFQGGVQRCRKRYRRAPHDKSGFCPLMILDVVGALFSSHINKFARLLQSSGRPLEFAVQNLSMVHHLLLYCAVQHTEIIAEANEMLQLICRDKASAKIPTTINPILYCLVCNVNNFKEIIYHLCLLLLFRYSKEVVSRYPSLVLRDVETLRTAKAWEVVGSAFLSFGVQVLWLISVARKPHETLLV